MIYSMLDMGRRAAALEELDKLTAERIAEAGEDSLDYGAMMLIKSETAHEITQLFTDYMDKTFGVSHHIAIGLSGSAPDDDKLDYETPNFDEDETMDGKWVDEEEERK
jgi:20S proteasome alpha/beta subunit